MPEKNNLPLLPLRDLVVFPETIVPIFLGRKQSVNALLKVKSLKNDDRILLTAQKFEDVVEPESDELFKIGILGKILQTVILPNDNAKILVETGYKVKLSNIKCDKFITANYSILSDMPIDYIDEAKQLTQDLIKEFTEYAESNKKISADVIKMLRVEKDMNKISYIIATHVEAELSVKQQWLEISNTRERIKSLIDVVESKNMHHEIEQLLRERVKKQVTKTQRDFYLNEQMKAIQKELDGGDGKSDFYDLEEKIHKTKLSKEAREKAESELKKLRMMNQSLSESYVVRNYLDTLLSMPWGKKNKKIIDINKTSEILDRDHYGLPKVKERIIEHLAVLTRAGKLSGSIICFIGPPGVGKTSLVKSIAESMNRQYVKFALGGVRDEAEIRGHRRTYLGSMPGKIISLIKKVKVDNPVMLLDEIDKMGSDVRGDPASALLEVLDPEQNGSFSDHYLEVEYDLSDIMFIATANSYNLPLPLLDRMEIINIAGYIEEEKIEIAKRHLVKKQMKNNGLRDNEFDITDDAIVEIIRHYTKEAGVRDLERKISTLARKVVTKIQKDSNFKYVKITKDNLEEYLGVKKYRFGLAEKQNQIGATTGLAYTEVGGDLLSIEAVSFAGEGKIKATGKLGDVMRESAETAYSCFLSKATQFDLKQKDYKKLDIHLHVPDGATPKDGPSAGIAIYTTLVSLMTNRAVDKNVAMTGEITLRGKVLPIGGLKEKLLAAKRGGIRKVIIPDDNLKDIIEIPDSIKNNLEILPVSNVEDVIDIALLK